MKNIQEKRKEGKYTLYNRESKKKKMKKIKIIFRKKERNDMRNGKGEEGGRKGNTRENCKKKK